MRIAVLIVGLLLPVLAYADENAPIDVRVQLKWFHQFQFAGFYAAIERGYFTDAGLNVTLLEGSPAINPADAVLAGHAEFGIGTSGLLLSRAHGRPVVAVAAIFQHSPYVLLARDEPGLRSPADLAGRTVMVEPYAEELIAYLRLAGVDIANLSLVDHTGDPLALTSGEIAALTAYTTTEPFILDRAGVAYRRFDPKVAGIDFYGDTLFTTEQFAARNEAVVLAFRDALIEGWRYALRHQDEIIDLIVEQYGSALSREHLRFEADEIRRLLIPDMIEIGYMNRTRWGHIADEFRSAGLLADHAAVDFDAFLFAPALPQDRTWLYLALLAALIAATVAGLAIKFYRLNQALAAEIETRRALEHELRQLAVTDAGTGALNRRGFMAALTGELKRCDRTGAPLSLLIIDLDEFKSINDRFGHAAGDQVLAEFARVCHETVRTVDVLGRLGGEEFAILLPETEGTGAAQLAERLRRNVEETSIQPAPEQQLSFTVSIGIAERRHREPLDALMYRADTAMYEAKNLGRNRIHGDLPPPAQVTASHLVH